MAKYKKTATEEETDLNLTPMLDVVFILLIFFIVTAVFIKEPGVDNRIPFSEISEKNKPTILVGVNSESEIWINNSMIELEEVRGELETLLATTPKAKILIQGDAESDSGIVMDVQEIVVGMNLPVQVETKSEKF